ncbi:flagellar biosynthetic protein FliR [Neobacillus drentensis]|uniref:flagellar biosynthetic protein FliR n=1 Tax=Neobacillus drentensis TaxID=220684 RepID=UPI0030009522
MNMDSATLWTLLLIFIRITTFMVTAPLFSGRQIPNQYKIGFSAVLSILCVGLVKEPIPELDESFIIVLILKEFLVGIVLGMVGNILLYAVQMAGSLMDVLIGFSMASLFDPTFGTSAQLSGRMQNTLALLVLLATDGHHLLIQGVLTSFDWIPIQATVPAFTDGHLASFLLDCVQQMFLIGFMMAAPIIGTLFLVDVALGIIARTVPQMNLFAVFPPMKIMIHFFIYIFILPSFFYLLKILFENMFTSMYSILKIMGV